MRVKAFSLMELIVVVLLLGIIFSLGLTLYSSKKQVFKSSNIKNLPQYIKKIGLKEDATFYIYGDKCEKNSLISNAKVYSDNSTFVFDKSYKIYSKDSLGYLKSVVFAPVVLDKKEQHVCFEINFNKGKFIDKLIIGLTSRYLLFSPFYQEVKSFNTLEKAQKMYLQNSIFPANADDYYQ